MCSAAQWIEQAGALKNPPVVQARSQQGRMAEFGSCLFSVATGTKARAAADTFTGAVNDLFQARLPLIL